MYYFTEFQSPIGTNKTNLFPKKTSPFRAVSIPYRYKQNCGRVNLRKLEKECFNPLQVQTKRSLSKQGSVTGVSFNPLQVQTKLYHIKVFRIGGYSFSPLQVQTKPARVPDWSKWIGVSIPYRYKQNRPCRHRG